MRRIFNVISKFRMNWFHSKPQQNFDLSRKKSVNSKININCIDNAQKCIAHLHHFLLRLSWIQHMNAAEHFRNIFNFFVFIFHLNWFWCIHTTLLLTKFMIDKFAILATPKKKIIKKQIFNNKCHLIMTQYVNIKLKEWIQ